MIRGVRIGELDRAVILENRTVTIDDYTHEKKETWSTLATVYAKRMTVSTEGYDDRQPVERITGKYLIRARTDVNAQMRINDAGAYHYIAGIENFDRSSYMVLNTIARDNG